jgi:hypothetical protein
MKSIAGPRALVALAACATALTAKDAHAARPLEWFDFDDSGLTSGPYNGFSSPYRIAWLIDTLASDGTTSVSLGAPLSEVYWVNMPDGSATTNNCEVDQYFVMTDVNGDGGPAFQASQDRGIPCSKDDTGERPISAARVGDLTALYLEGALGADRWLAQDASGAPSIDAVCNNLVGWDQWGTVQMGTIGWSQSRAAGGNWTILGNWMGPDLVVYIQCTTS